MIAPLLGFSVTAGVLSFALSGATASTVKPFVYCEDFADNARAIAAIRDTGLTLDEFFYVQQPDQFLANTAANVYRNPTAPPDVIYDEFYRTCLDTLRPTS